MSKQQHCTISPGVPCEGDCIRTGVFVNEDNVPALEAAGLVVTLETPPARTESEGDRPMVHLCPELQDDDERLGLVARATGETPGEIARAIHTTIDMVRFMDERAATDALAGWVVEQPADGDPQ